MSGRAVISVETILLGILVLIAAGCSLLPRRHAPVRLAPADSAAAPAASLPGSGPGGGSAPDSGNPSHFPPEVETASARTGDGIARDSHSGPRAPGDQTAAPALSVPSAPSSSSPPAVSVELSDTERVALVEAYQHDVRVADSLAFELRASARGEASDDDLAAMRNLIAMAGEAYEGRDYSAAANLARKARLLAEDAFKARRGSR